MGEVIKKYEKYSGETSRIREIIVVETDWEKFVKKMMSVLEN